MNINLLALAALSGFASAVAVDYDAYKKSNNRDFDWGLALIRWVKGAIMGALSATPIIPGSPLHVG